MRRSDALHVLCRSCGIAAGSDGAIGSGYAAALETPRSDLGATKEDSFGKGKIAAEQSIAITLYDFTACMHLSKAQTRVCFDVRREEARAAAVARIA